MNYSANRKNLLWLGIATAIGAAGSLFSSFFTFSEDYLHHPVFHIFTFLTDIFANVFLCSPFILLAVYIFHFAEKKLNHRLLSASCILFLITCLWGMLVVGGATLVFGFEDLLNAVAPLETLKNIIMFGFSFAFLGDLHITLGFYESLLSLIFAVLATISVNKGFKMLKLLKILAIAMVVLNILNLLYIIPFGIDEISYGNSGYLPSVVFDSVATVSFFLFWIFGIKKTENNLEQTDAKTEIAKAKYLLEIGLISQEEFEKKKEKILEQN